MIEGGHTSSVLPAPVVEAQQSTLEEQDGIEWPGGTIKYDAAATTPISRWAAWLMFNAGGWLARLSFQFVPACHPWRIFHEGHFAMRRETVGGLPRRGLVHIGEREPRYITAIKLAALLLVAYACLSVVFDLGRYDLFGFDLIHLHFGGTDL